MSRRSLARALTAALVLALVARAVYVQTYWTWNDREETFRAAAAGMNWPVDDMVVQAGGFESSLFGAEERRTWVVPGEDATRYEIVLARGLLSGFRVRRASVGPAEPSAE